MRDRLDYRSVLVTVRFRRTNNHANYTELLLPKAWEAGLPTICRAPATNIEHPCVRQIEEADFTTAPQSIADKSGSHALRAESTHWGAV